MSLGRSLREPVRVLMHLNEGFTRVLLERTEAVGMANGGIEWDIRTELIPPDLRPIGSRFVATLRQFTRNSPMQLVLNWRRLVEKRCVWRG